MLSATTLVKAGTVLLLIEPNIKFSSKGFQCFKQPGISNRQDYSLKVLVCNTFIEFLSYSSISTNQYK